MLIRTIPLSEDTHYRHEVLEDSIPGYKPCRFSQPELNRAGTVILERHHNIHLACLRCGRTWSPMIQIGGRLPRGYWICPDGCNLPSQGSRRLRKHNYWKKVGGRIDLENGLSN